MKIALAGNPNSGKTTLYNAITGKNESVGNWPGVTVSKKEADLKRKYSTKGDEVRIVDLPGAYSISPFTGEEVITSDFVLNEKPDVIINIVDGANVSRSLFFTTQLLELGIPVVVAVNKNDILSKRGDTLSTEALSKELNCKVVSITATSEQGVADLIKEAVKAGNEKKSQVAPTFAGKESSDSDLARQKFVDNIIKKCQVKKRDASKVTLSDKVDRFVAHKWLGLPIFFLVMWALYALAISTSSGGPGGALNTYLNESFFAETVPNAANSFLEGIGAHPLVQSLVVDGIIAGVGAILGFLPLIMVLFFFLALLEDSGYMSRVAVVLDRYFKKIGLSGKSIIPMVVGTGCSVPGVMATRTIDDINQKRKTIILTPFVPCGAKLPIIALFAAAFFPETTWMLAGMYIIAFAMIIVGGLLLNKIFKWEDTTSDFIMELPEYKIPSLKRAIIQMLDRAKAFIVKAGTIILVFNAIIWFAQTYNFSLQVVEDPGTSILAAIGSVIAIILIPLGFVGWQLGAAALSGFVAKENVIATFAVIFAVSEDALHVVDGPLAGFFTPVTALAFLVFNLFTPPCFAAIGAMNSEMGSRKWLWKGLAFQLGVGYTLAMLVSQIGSLMVYGQPANGWVPAIVIAAILAIYLTYSIRKSDSTPVEIDVAVE